MLDRSKIGHLSLLGGARPRVRRVAARLVYDTRAQSLPAGVRAVIQGARHLLFAADELEVVLQVLPDVSPGRARVMGQVVADGVPLAGAAVRLAGPTGPSDGATDRLGQFKFSALVRGDYSLEIGTAAQVLDIPIPNVSAG